MEMTGAPRGLCALGWMAGARGLGSTSATDTRCSDLGGYKAGFLLSSANTTRHWPLLRPFARRQRPPVALKSYERHGAAVRRGITLGYDIVTRGASRRRNWVGATSDGESSFFRRYPAALAEFGPG